jgi:hypothetical protein
MMLAPEVLQIRHQCLFSVPSSKCQPFWCFAMKSAAEYRAYAEQCIESAKTAHSQEARDALLEMARVWIDAAHQTEGLRGTQRTAKPER